jgi:hypothetical protein
MQKLFVSVLFTCLNGFFLWLLAAGSWGAYLLPVAIVVALGNLVLGLRLGYLSAWTYAEDVARLNRYLCDQNEDLVLSNRELLERFASSEGLRTQSREDEMSRLRARS